MPHSPHMQEQKCVLDTILPEVEGPTVVRRPGFMPGETLQQVPGQFLRLVEACHALWAVAGLNAFLLESAFFAWAAS